MLQRLGWMVVAGLLVTLAGAQLARAQPAPKDMSQKADQSWDSLKSYTVEKKQQAMATGRKVMRAIDRDIKDLQRSGAKASKEAKAEMNKDIKALQAERAETEKKLIAMRKASAEAWEGAKTAFIDAARGLNESVQKAAEKLKK